jgi:hypothetical protein
MSPTIDAGDTPIVTPAALSLPIIKTSWMCTVKVACMGCILQVRCSHYAAQGEEGVDIPGMHAWIGDDDGQTNSGNTLEAATRKPAEGEATGGEQAGAGTDEAPILENWRISTAEGRGMRISRLLQTDTYAGLPVLPSEILGNCTLFENSRKVLRQYNSDYFEKNLPHKVAVENARQLSLILRQEEISATSK